MLRQTDIFQDFVHDTEKLPETQKILDDYRFELAESTKRVYDFLMSGNEGTVHDMKADRSRLSDLKRAGFQFSFKMQGRFKVWFCTPAQVEFNKKRMEELKQK